MVLPVPGGPDIRTLCPPAAAISSARLAVSCPLMSFKSKSVASTVKMSLGAGTFSGVRRPERHSIASESDSISYTLSSLAKAASSPLPLGIKSVVNPAVCAARAEGSTPETGRNAPSSPSSPKNIFPDGSNVICPDAKRYPSAIGKSKAGPSFLMSAGAKLTITRWLFLCGASAPRFRMAALIRSRDSCTSLSARPTMEKIWSPGEISTSTDIGWASKPTT